MRDTRDGYFATILDLVEYEVRCNRRAVGFLGGLAGRELYRDFGFGLRTPHRTIAHIADGMRGWSGCVGPGIRPPAWTDYDATEPVESIGARITDVGEAWREAARASHARGLLGQDRRLHQLFHLVTHGTHHRGQLLSMIRLMGHPQPFEGGDFGGWSNRRG